jgi:hypothetical protein
VGLLGAAELSGGLQPGDWAILGATTVFTGAIGTAPTYAILAARRNRKVERRRANRDELQRQQLLARQREEREADAARRLARDRSEVRALAREVAAAARDAAFSAREATAEAAARGDELLAKELRATGDEVAALAATAGAVRPDALDADDVLVARWELLTMREDARDARVSVGQVLALGREEARRAATARRRASLEADLVRLRRELELERGRLGLRRG